MNTTRQQATLELLTRANRAKLYALCAEGDGLHGLAESYRQQADVWLREAIRFAKRDALLSKGGE